MQRKIAEELQLDLETMAMFDKQDEEDDFNGLDHGSRDVILSVSQVILRTLIYAKFMVIFLNGSDDEIDMNRFGINPDLLDLVMVWTFKKRSLTIHDTYRNRQISDKLRYTHIFIHTYVSNSLLDSSSFVALLREDAADRVALHPCMQGIDLTVVTECCLYELFLQHSFHRATGFDWVAQAPNYWICDGIIKGDGTRGISDTLHQEILWKIDSSQVGQVFGKLIPEVPFLIAKDDTPLLIKRSYRWISVTSENLMGFLNIATILEC
ncbi:unnamed protein product [Miscanthus lutarioriparius]|uniref:Uncharacterized protein n=1 Tax=Miscanthus lutarioriparius TaxID=422564 RepID=A0A811QWT0_9POAL|nr:unnamed protein product [Miscanthus lutarioriparius]